MGQAEGVYREVQVIRQRLPRTPIPVPLPTTHAIVHRDWHRHSEEVLLVVAALVRLLRSQAT